VDLPDPPFSLPTTITCADRARLVISIAMDALANLVGVSRYSRIFLLEPLLILIRKLPAR
jgi:hypothetical protein